MKKIISLVLFLTMLFPLAGCFGKKDKAPDIINRPPQSAKEDSVYTLKSPLTGLEVIENKGIMAIVVENYKAARPQSGLDKADIIYEMLAEGGITRFVALFSSQATEEVGPVRSARPYLVEVAREWEAVFVHFGGTKAGYQAIKNYDVKDIDGLVRNNLFWRDKKRRAPHNAYSTTETLRKFQDASSPPSARWDFAQFDGSPQFMEITVPYNKGTTVKYVFDNTSRKYLRFVNNEPHLDRPTGKQLGVSNIIVQYASHSLADDQGHYKIDLQGEGKAEFFLGGKYLAGSWKKESLGSATVFKDEQGQPVKFAPGNTWIQVVPKFLKIEKK